jgi:hypothetical protein
MISERSITLIYEWEYLYDDKFLSYRSVIKHSNTYKVKDDSWRFKFEVNFAKKSCGF